MRTRLRVAIVALLIMTETASGAEFLGWNQPWWAHGHDDGQNAWGHDGISTDGWSVSTHPSSRGFTRSRVIKGEPCAGCGSLRLTADMDQSRPSGEVVLDLLSHSPLVCPTGPAGPLDLRRARVRFKLWLPPGTAGPVTSRSGVQVIFKTRLDDERWASVYTAWQNIEPRWENTWVEFTVPVTTIGAAYVDVGADLGRVNLVGIKVALGSQSTSRLVGSIYLDDFVIETDPPLAWDFERLTVDREFSAIRDLSSGAMTTARVFLCADGRACPEFDASGRVTTFDDGAFYDDFDALLDVAMRNGVRLIVTVFDYSLARLATNIAGVQLGGRADLLRQPDHREAFLNAFAEVLRRYSNHPAILAWQPINEPEWVTEELPERIPTGVDYIPIESMRAFVRAMTESIHRLSPTHAVTIGSARRARASLWTGVGLDAVGVHWYETLGDEPFPFLPCPEGLDAPCYIEEVPTAGTNLRASQMLASAQDAGYLGFMPFLPWSCRARDQYSDLPSALFELYGTRR